MKKGLFNWSYFVILIPVHYFVILFTVAPQPLTLRDAWRWFIVATVAYVITGIGFAVANHFQDQMKSSRVELAAAALLGAVRGFAILDVTLLMELPVAKPYLIRPLNSAVVVPIWLLVTHLILGTRREFQNEFHRMYVRTIASQIAEHKSKSRASIEGLASKIEDALAPLRKQFESALGLKMSAQQLADDALIIRSFVEAEIRPLSHELWRSRKFKPPRLSFLRVLRYSLLHEKLPLNMALIPSFLFSFAGLSSTYGFENSFLKTLSITLTLVIISLAYALIFRIHALPKPLINIIAIASALLLPGKIDNLWEFNFDLGVQEGKAEIIGAVWLFMLILGFSAYKGVTTYYDSIRTIIQRQIDSIDTEDLAATKGSMTREFASYLHGDVQSELLSASMQMQQAAEAGDLKLGKRALKRANELLRRDHQTYVVGNAIDPSAKLERLAVAWDGIAAIEFSIDPSFAISESAIGLVTDVVEELISNAVRHGSAKKITVLVGAHNSDVKVTFHDDGAEMKSGKKGLGSEILKKQTLTYDYERNSEGNQIVITLPN